MMDPVPRWNQSAPRGTGFMVLTDLRDFFDFLVYIVLGGGGFCRCGWNPVVANHIFGDTPHRTLVKVSYLLDLARFGAFLLVGSF